MQPNFARERRIESLRALLRFWLALSVFVLLSVVALAIDRIHHDPLAVTNALRGIVVLHDIEVLHNNLTIMAIGLTLIEVLLLMSAVAGASQMQSRHWVDRRAVRDSEQFAHATFDALPAQIAILDESGQVLSVNRAWREFGGADAARAVERTLEGGNFLSSCDAAIGQRSQEAAAIAQAVRSVAAGQSNSSTLECTADSGPGGGVAWYLLRVTRFPAENRARVIVLFEDITHRKRAEEQVQRSKELADQANAAKSAFLANMSHEIRTPMTAILGYTDLLQDSALDAQRRDRCVQIIRRNGEHLLAIINDILDLSKIEADKLTIERLPTSLPQLVAEVASLIRQRADARQLDFSVVFDGPVPQTVHTDALRLKQVLINLLGNAVKFTQKGGVTLRVACHEQVGGSTLQFDVIDTGVGMDARQADRVFRPFSQGDESTTRRFGGTGLGLSISRRLAQLLGGNIRVSSSPGEGSTFSVWIDGGSLSGVTMLRDLHEDQLQLDGRQPTRGRLAASRRLLLAEDGEDNRELISTVLRDAGFEVILAENGAVAVRVAREREGDIDLVLMDMQMPEVDGYTATKVLRDGGFKKPIVAITAHAMTDDRQRCINSGCDDYLSKPLDRAALINTIVRLTKATLIEESAPAAPAKPSAPQGEQIRSTHAGDAKLAGVLQRFVERLPLRIAEIEQFLADRNAAELQRVIHQLKGAAGGYGFPVITEQAARVETLLRGGAGLEQVEPEIRKVVLLLRRVDGCPGSPTGAQTTAAAKGERVLLVDDSPAVHELVHAALQAMPVELVGARDVASGLALAVETRPSLLLLDVDLPDGTGYQVCQKLKESKLTADIPVIFLTAIDSPDARTRASDLGAAGFMPKPFDAVELGKTVAACLEQVRTRRQLAERSRTDTLTGLPNRHFLENCLSVAISNSRREGTQVTCVAVDIDDMAGFNRVHGFGAGDALIREVGRVFSAAGGDASVARAGEDEFVLVLETPNEAVSEQLIPALEAAVQSVSVTTQAGTATATCTTTVVPAARRHAGGRQLLEAIRQAMASEKTRRKLLRGGAAVPKAA